MKKKLFLFFNFVVVLCIGIAIGKFNNTNDLYEEKSEQKQKKNANMLSMMLETEAESGNYEMTTRDSWPTSGYKFNSELSKCENGGELSWDNENKRVLMSGNISDKCYVYFDKEYLKVLLNDYIFSWEPISNATSYQIYSDDKLLITTGNTSAEIYEYYDEPGTYNISVKAVDDKNQVLLDSNVIAYSLEKTTVELPSTNFFNLNTDVVSCIAYSTSYDENQNCGRIDFESAGNGESYSSEIIDDNNYKINVIDFKEYLNNVNLKYEIHVNTITFVYSNNLKNNYCLNSSLCTSYNLSDLNISHTSEPTYTFSYKNSKLTFEHGSSTGVVVYALQLVEPGKISSDWKLFGTHLCCLSSNTDVYVYDKKKKKFKKKKIDELSYDDEILCWDFDKGEFVIAKPIWIKKCEQTNKYNLLKFSDGSTLETINQHRIFNVEKGMFTYPMSDDTPIGTTTFNSKGEYVKLISKEVIEKPIDYYNVMTEYHINLFANDILTSCRLSNMYKVKDMKYVCNKKRNNGYDLSKYDEKLVNGLRLKEQDIEETKLKTYVDNMLRLMK